VTIRPASTRCAVTAVPLLDPFPGLPSIPYNLRGNRTSNEPADAITALVLLTWALYWAVHGKDIDYTPLHLVTVHHKATLIEGGGLEWWTRGCSCDRAALCLVNEIDADFLRQAADKGLRPRKPRTPRLYAYLGGGVDHQPEQVSSIVIRTRDPELLAAVVAAARLAMATWPSGEVVKTYYDNLVDGDGTQAQDLALKVLEYDACNPTGVGEPARHLVLRTFETIMQFVLPPSQPRTPPTNAQLLVQETIVLVDEDDDPPASALHRDTSAEFPQVEPFEPDWSAPGEEEPPPMAPPPGEWTATSSSSSSTPFSTTTAKARPKKATPSTTLAVRFGIDLGGVLWPFMREGLDLRLALRTGPLEAAQERMASLVSRIGADNVFIVSKVGARAEKLWATVLQESGFYRDTGMRPENVHWVRDRTGTNGKAPVVQQFQLTHFVDDRSDVLRDIKRHFARQRLTAPVLYIVPTTTWHGFSREALPTAHDREQAQLGAYSLGNAVFAEHLGEVPLPDPAARPTAH